MIVSIVGQISASFSPVSVVNEFENGIIDIEIVEEKTDNEKSTQMLLPFDKIDKNTYITNNGSDCYVRTKLCFSNDEIVNNVNLVELNPDWIVHNDGYYYYTKILKSNETVSLFKGIELGDINKAYELSEFGIDIKADAIQSKNFTADFTSINPWGDVEILKVNEEGTTTEYKAMDSETFKVIYQDDTKNLVKNFDSFFNNAQTLMPGDTYEDVLELQNNTNNEEVIYFATQNILNKDFLDKVKFSIFDENFNMIFNGTLGEDTEMVLITLDAATSTKITFKIEVPKEVNNEFVLDKSSVKWIFSTQYIDATPPQTGDNAHIEIYASLMIISIVGLFFSIKGLKYGKKNP